MQNASISSLVAKVPKQERKKHLESKEVLWLVSWAYSLTSILKMLLPRRVLLFK